MICFYSSEELFGIFEQETIIRSNLENPKKQLKSIKAAYGGFTNGEKECAKLVKEFLNELYNAGIIPWSIGHTKLKTVKDKASLDEDGFQKLGSSLIADYESAIADCFDIIVTGLIDREIEEKGEGDSVKRYVKETERRLYFRGNEIVEAGGRLKGLAVPEYIVFDKDNMGATFIETVETALKAGRITDVKTAAPKKTTKPALAPVVEEEPELEEELEEGLPFEPEEEELETESEPVITADDVRALFKSADKDKKAEVKQVLADYDGKLDNADQDGLNRMYAILTV